MITAEALYILMINKYGDDFHPRDFAIEFAKLHVQSALIAALEDAPCGSSTDTVSYEDMRNAIIDAYPLTNIK